MAENHQEARQLGWLNMLIEKSVINAGNWLGFGAQADAKETFRLTSESSRSRQTAKSAKGAVKEATGALEPAQGESPCPRLYAIQSPKALIQVLIRGSGFVCAF